MDNEMDKNEIAQFEFDMEVFVEMYASGKDYDTVSEQVRNDRKIDREWDCKNQNC